MADKSDKQRPVEFVLRDPIDVKIVLGALKGFRWCIGSAEIGVGPEAKAASRRAGGRLQARAKELAAELKKRAEQEVEIQVEATEHDDPAQLAGEMARRLADKWGCVGMSTVEQPSWAGKWRCYAWWARERRVSKSERIPTDIALELETAPG